jgi:hypothetical protein
MNERVTCWHSAPVEQIFVELDSRPEGLSDAAAATRLHVYGANRIERKRNWNWLKVLWRCSPSAPMAQIWGCDLRRIWVSS